MGAREGVNNLGKGARVEYGKDTFFKEGCTTCS